MLTQFNPPHPGELLQEYIEGRSVTEVARHLGVDRTTLSRLLHGKSDLSADMALRFEAALGTSASMWLGMQRDYDLWQARQQKRPVIKRFAEMAA
ncbi:HigA family addiction module antidote protein [Undibacterium sp. CY18W]|uniref:HigA family addiction module antidote protein n=1 Tax=Undibacterium hunanense TaxID=2762292 RepID=A0ABR6ZLZ4_9BURK|nr:HigA family addiction module antitoxin [Undibacterium hunanense]MBC3916938.1 HigA family addiction module antidote protein [Undibacterium hunanense]